MSKVQPIMIIVIDALLLVMINSYSIAGELRSRESRGLRSHAIGSRVFSGRGDSEYAKPRLPRRGELALGKVVGVQVDSITGKARSSTADRIKLKHDFKLISANEVRGNKLWQRRKVPKVAFFCNVFLPGLGEVYNGRRIKAAVMVGLMSFYMGEAWLNYKRSIIRKIARDRHKSGTHRWFFQNEWYEFHNKSAKDYLWWSGAVWVIGMLDAYIDAHLFDLRAYSPEKERGRGKYLTVSWKF